ncbi:hypothetical protein L1887_38523 [Cichorium endivia]|nr:hypothetical protein L1887_38523 [Cichorium endivia]
METYSLTKESDVYSFGVVLFEVLCGRLCFEINNGHFRCFVRMWIESYEEKKLNEIIFQDLKQHMDPRSLETFSDIAYQCLQKSREERPMMSSVVKKLEIAHRFQEISEDYEKVTASTVTPLVDEDWICCNKCQKWRLLPPGRNPHGLTGKWICSMLDWLPGMNDCSISEDETTKATTYSFRRSEIQSRKVAIKWLSCNTGEVGREFQTEVESLPKSDPPSRVLSKQKKIINLLVRGKQKRRLLVT